MRISAPSRAYITATSPHPPRATTGMSQSTIAIGLLKSGSLLFTAAFTWGIFIPKTPFPRIAVSNHVNMIQHGLLSIGAGLILYQRGLIELSEWQVWLVGLSHFYLWVLDFVSICNAWWGTNKTLQVLAKEAGATGGKTWQEILVKMIAFGAASLIPAWGVIAYKLF